MYTSFQLLFLLRTEELAVARNYLFIVFEIADSNTGRGLSPLQSAPLQVSGSPQGTKPP